MWKRSSARAPSGGGTAFVSGASTTSPPGARGVGSTFIAAAALLLAMALDLGAAVVEHPVSPRATDPAIRLGLDDHLAVLDTSLPPSRDLFVFLPGTGGKPADTRLILREAAASGFRAIGLMYADANAVLSLCPQSSTDADCAAKVRREIIAGEDASPLLTVTRPDSIESRLAKVLAFLAASYPQEGWGAWLASGEPVWRRIRFAGWSQGGGHAAFIANDREVAGAIFFGSPQDYDLRLGTPAPWIREAHRTPASRYFGFTHLSDATALWPRVELIWSILGLGAFGPPVSVDGASWPFGGSHQLVTSRSYGSNFFHGIPIADAFTPLLSDGSPAFRAAWKAVAFWEAEPDPFSWIFPSAARAAGANGAFFTTDLTIANLSAKAADVTLKLLGHSVDGRDGVETTRRLDPGSSFTYADVLASAFGVVGEDYGAIRLASTAPLDVVGQTSTPGFGGTFGQSVPAASASEWIAEGLPRTIVAIREDAGFRTNLVVVNATEAALEVDLLLRGADGAVLGSRRLEPLQPLETRQVSRVAEVLTGRADIRDAALVLSTPTARGAFAAYASVIDNTTNDPRTLLPR